MDALKAQFERIRQQLSALTATQKMLVAALIAVMVMTVLYWGRFAGNPEMVPVLDQTLTDDDIGPIDLQLKLAGIPHTVTSDKKVLVPADRQPEILADLMFARVLPQDTHSAFDAMSKSINPFSSNTQTEMAYSESKAVELGSIISRFPGVANARVLINAKTETKIEGSILPSATVFINTRGEPEHMKDLVRGAADGVAHAVSNLRTDHISVIVNGASQRVPSSDNGAGMGSEELDEKREKREHVLEQKIHDVFCIYGLTVTVNCDVENKTVEKNDQSYKLPKEGTLITTISSKESTDTVNNQAPASQEPGVVPNTDAGVNGPASLAGGGGSGGGSTQEHHTEDGITGVWPGSSIIKTLIPAGKDSVLSATVRVPRSYFENVYKHDHPDFKGMEPPKEFSDSELAKIRSGVKTLTALKSDEALSVEAFSDFQPDLAMAIGPVATTSALNTVGGHAKEIGIGLLAVVSLFMMATMVRKSSPGQLVLPSLAGALGQTSPSMAMVGVSAIGNGETIAGEVGGGTGALDAMEMDEDSVRTQQMLDQVSTMVKENPDGAAALVKRWLSRP